MVVFDQLGCYEGLVDFGAEGVGGVAWLWRGVGRLAREEEGVRGKEGGKEEGGE